MREGMTRRKKETGLATWWWQWRHGGCAGSDRGRMEVGYEGAAGSAALIKLAEDNEPVCRLACLAV